MAEANTAELEAKADAAFGAAFNGTPPDDPPAKVVEEAPPEPEKPAAEPEKVAAAPPPEKPQYIRLTKQEWDNTKAAAGKVSSLESQVAKLMGAMPKAEQLVQQVVQQVRSQTPAGSRIKLTKEDLAELSEDFPELSDKILAGLGRAFERAEATGTGPAEPDKPPTPSPAQPVDVDAALEKALFNRENKALVTTYPDWRDIVGARPQDAPEDWTPDPKNEFRVWLARQSPEYQKAVNETDSPADVQSAIASFKASRTTPAKPDRAAARRAVIEDAVTPRAEGNPPPLNPPQTADEAFMSGFRAVKRN